MREFWTKEEMAEVDAYVDAARAREREQARALRARYYRGYSYDGEFDGFPDPERLPVWSHLARHWDGRHWLSLHGPDHREMTWVEFCKAVDERLAQ